MNKKTVSTISKMKKDGQKITMLTCYDYAMAKLVSSQDIDSLLIGDSLGVVKLGYENTLPVTVDDMIYHTKAVKRGNAQALIVTDMPFMSYEITACEAVRNAARIIKEGGAEAVKIEGGIEILDKVKAILDAKIPVVGHLGLTPQAINKFGGHKVQARQDEAQKKLIEDAKALEKAGVFAIVLEAVPADLGKKLSETLSIPVIGIGAGKDCDGQVLVIDDMLGMFTDFTPKFVKKYANVGETVKEAVKNYIDEVRSGKFPSQENTYK
ncbi:3-methyl-2-oxobutanoate hydroxymethyltransferase [Endomicrobium proavitum]|uniref:3-methyl-2-oxobutanoate hydroxymethyltransferase n=1 Tax=Endomicrobium proavitum TaxID=1408281 RepID=A0A0G3WJS4_9BACT|nr:3-methyl-2-oxobutanoate hydroxymethyltransferase [Endomicrobium proavitum]AKL98130.1 3-methyl-2-oxobutanoate hydroxymethyltransferase [Endomicrobium proavitum]